MLRFLSLLSCFTLFVFPAQAKPVVIELFGENECASDVEAQEALYEVIRNNPDVLLINCRKTPLREEVPRIFSRQFCNDREQFYKKRFQTSTYFQTSWLIVNGRWDANYQNVEPAVKLGRTDKVSNIQLDRKGDVLNISIPDIKSDKGYGELFVYAYAPTQDSKSVFVDPDVSLTPKMEEDLRQDKSVPFVTKIRTSQFLVRPVFALKNIARWTGKKTFLSISIKDMMSMTETLKPDLSFAVVLHEGDGSGRVLASGELQSLMEVNNTLPKSVPDRIEFMSIPTVEIPVQ